MLSHNNNSNNLGNNAQRQQSSSCLRLHYFPASTTPQQMLRSHMACTGLEPTHIPSSLWCPTVADPFGRANPPPPPVFHWLMDRQDNNNSAESSSRKVAAKETMQTEIDNWFFMNFRIRMEGHHSLVYAIKQSAKGESIYNEDYLDKWTIKLRFKIRRAAALREAMFACSSRLGLDDDPDVIYCVDGFYGDSSTGRIGNKHEVPNQIVQPTYTSCAMRLRNGSNLFVSRVTQAERDNAAEQMRLDLQQNDTEDDDEDESNGNTDPASKMQLENFQLAA